MCGKICCLHSNKQKLAILPTYFLYIPVTHVCYVYAKKNAWKDTSKKMDVVASGERGRGRNWCGGNGQRDSGLIRKSENMFMSCLCTWSSILIQWRSLSSVGSRHPAGLGMGSFRRRLHGGASVDRAVR